jgi:hypothetical protein
LQRKAITMLAFAIANTHPFFVISDTQWRIKEIEQPSAC